MVEELELEGREGISANCVNIILRFMFFFHILPHCVF